MPFIICETINIFVNLSKKYGTTTGVTLLMYELVRGIRGMITGVCAILLLIFSDGNELKSMRND